MLTWRGGGDRDPLVGVARASLDCQGPGQGAGSTTEETLKYI